LQKFADSFILSFMVIDSESTTTIAQDSDTRALLKPRHPLDFLLKNGSFGGAALKAGEIVEGVVLEKRRARLFVDLGMRGVGVIFGKEFSAANDIIKDLDIGSLLSAKIVDPDNEEGYIELSLKEAGEERRWIDLKKMMQDGETLELPILEANRGGLILEVKGVKGFLPASQLSTKNYPRVDGGDKEKIYLELQKLVGQPFQVKILDLNPQEQKLIFTEKNQTSAGTQEVLSKYKKGDEVAGEITSVVDFGAFMRFDEGGLEGLVHISEIDWSLIEDPRSILKPGDKVRAKIIDIQGDKVSLSLKQLKEDPWSKIEEKYHRGDVVKGTVTKFNPFGAFIQLDADIHGLAHISEFGTEAKMREMMQLGSEYQFKILLIDPKDHRMSLGFVKEDQKTE